MYDRILVPTDGSTGTAHVALQAIDLAEQYGATIYPLHVIEAIAGSFPGTGEGEQSLEQRADNAVTTIARMAESHGVDCVTEVRQGDPSKTILSYADEIDADLIVAGTHGRSGIRRHLIGSVAERLVRHATCPVMTVHLPDTDVTVEESAEAREIVAQTLDDAGYDAEITDIERQLSVWVVTADTGGGDIVVYLDPETQRTSIIEREE